MFISLYKTPTFKIWSKLMYHKPLKQQKNLSIAKIIFCFDSS